MAKYKVIFPFYKLYESKDYRIGDEIELSKEDAKAMEVYLEAEVKEDKTKNKK